MDVFIYCADIYCEDCGRAIQDQHMAQQGAEDSDTYPQGPYPNGGGEADSPQHCGSCGVFLDNPLTGDGESYVRDAFGDYVEIGRGDITVLGDWKAAYGYAWDDWVEITLPLLTEDKPLKAAAQARFDELEAL